MPYASVPCQCAMPQAVRQGMRITLEVESHGLTRAVGHATHGFHYRTKPAATPSAPADI